MHQLSKSFFYNTQYLPLCWMAAFCLLAGCGDPGVLKMGKKPWIPKQAHWPELDILIDNPDPKVPSLRRFLRSFNGGGGDVGRKAEKGICQQISIPAFQENLKKFEDTPIPAEFLDAEREQNKKVLISAIRELQQKACGKKVEQKELQEIISKLPTLMGKLREIPGQQPPPQ